MSVGMSVGLSACSVGDEAADPTTGTIASGTASSSTPLLAPNGSTPSGSNPGTSRPPGARPPEVQDLSITISGMSVLPNTGNAKVSWGIVYRNPNTNWIAQVVTVKVSLLDASEKEVGTDTFVTKVVAPASDAAAANVLRAPGATKMKASFTTGSWRRTDTTWPAFGIGETTVDQGSVNGTQFKTIVSSPYKVPLPGFTIVVIAVQGLTVAGGDALLVGTTPGNAVLPVSVLAGGVFPAAVTGARFFVLPSTLPSPDSFAPDGAPVPTTKPPGAKPPATKPPVAKPPTTKPAAATTTVPTKPR